MAHLMNFKQLLNDKMNIDMKQEVWWVQPLGNIYCIALNYGPGIYFFPTIFNQTTKQDRRLFLEETCAVYNL